MKTCTFIFWISLLVLFPQGLFSKSLNIKEQYGSNSENSNEHSEIGVENGDVALHESFRPRHKYKANGRQTRVYRNDNENSKDQEIKPPQCAVMYKDNEPVGILQPFKESYRFLPVSGDPTLVDINPIPVKRKTIMDVLYPSKMSEDYSGEMADNNNQFTDDRYPSIFAKFKIDSRLDKSVNPDLNMKRSMFKRDTERPDTNSDQENSPRSTLSNIKEVNSAVVEEKLKNILDDMGLIDDYTDKEEAKREIAEDENMEQGTNKINLVKEEHNETRNKRGDINKIAINERTPSATESNENSTDAEIPTRLQNFEEEHTDDVESIDLLQGGEAKLNDISDKQDLRAEPKLQDNRKKRQELLKGVNDKRDTPDSLPDTNLNNSSLVKEAELNQYEKRVEREIRDKIQKLKEEVKEEIKNLKTTSEVNNEKSETKRKKRQVVNTLIDEETQDIDPNLNDEKQNEKHHVRRKRSLDFDDPLILDKKKYEVKNTTRSSKVIKIFENNDSLETKQKYKENTDELRFIINFGIIDPKIKKEVKLNNGDKQVMSKNKLVEVKENKTFNALRIKSAGKEGDVRTEENEATSSLKYHDNIKRRGTDFKFNSSDELKRLQVYTPFTFNSKTFVNYGDRKKNNISEMGNKIIHGSNCTDTTCPITHIRNKNKISHSNIKNNIKEKYTFDKETSIPSSFSNASNQFNNDTKKKNIIGILKVIEKKKQNTKNNPYNGNLNNDIHENDVKNMINKTNKEDALFKEIKNDQQSIYDTRSPENVAPKKMETYLELNINSSPYPLTARKEKIIDYNLSEFTTQSKDFPKSYDIRDGIAVRNLTEIKRFVGTNSILQNSLNFTNHYRSRSLAQFKDDENNTDLKNERHVRIKRSDDDADRLVNDISNNRNYNRIKRQSNEDLENNAYQYDDSESNEAEFNDNQVYDDQPYVNENSVTSKFSNSATSNVKTNCNCDKSDSGCKCGTQKSDLSVPNIIGQDYSDHIVNPDSIAKKRSVSHCHCDKNGKHCKCQSFKDDSQYSDYTEIQSSSIEEDSADYMANPDSIVKKKSINHCHCDKNGKHCNCQTFKDDSQYSDYAEIQSSNIEQDSARIDNDGTVDELEGDIKERTPRRSSQKKRKTRNSDAEDLAEDYYANYEMESDKVMKREAKPTNRMENQQFQNGEYFLDMHPEVYRLTPVEPREKRHTFKDLVAIHGGGPVANHLVAIKQRSMLPHLRFRRRVQNEDNREPRQLIDMSDEDLFGALPQSFAGELARYKRVKRGKNGK